MISFSGHERVTHAEAGGSNLVLPHEGIRVMVLGGGGQMSRLLPIEYSGVRYHAMSRIYSYRSASMGLSKDAFRAG